MQEIVHKSYIGSDSLRSTLLLKKAPPGDFFNHHQPMMLPMSESDDCNSESEEFNIHFNQKPSQDFGLGYWMKHTNVHRYEPSLSNSKSPQHTAFIPKSITVISNEKKTKNSDTFPILKKEKSKKPKHNLKSKKHRVKEQISNSSNLYSDKTSSNIPRLKIPKDVVKKYLKTLSPLSSCSSSSSDSESLHNQNFKYQNKSSKCKSKSINYLSDTPLSDHNDSSCLQKSFQSSKYSKPKSVYHLSAASHDNMLLSMTIDQNLLLNISSLPVINDKASVSPEIIDSVQLESANQYVLDPSDTCLMSCETNETKTENRNTNHSTESIAEDRICLSKTCDNQEAEIKKVLVEEKDNDFEIFNQSSISNRKRLLDQESVNTEESGVTSKKKMLATSSSSSNQEDPNWSRNMVAVDYVKLLMNKMKYFEEMVHEKYCLSQPNAMKFLAQNHALNWESYKNDLNQLHLVPCEFIAEIFHRALHCFGLEKRLLKETLSVDSSPICRFDINHSTEYKKVRDEYSFSLKRVRYGIGVIDDLFKRKTNFQCSQPNSDVTVVRKWKHLIYYLCLQAKAVFMTKEMQYHNYANYCNPSGGTFDVECGFLFNTTPTAKNSSSVVDSNKSQLPKDSSKLYETKFIKSTPDHLSQFDMDVSPHSYDSGKGSSIRLSSNGNSQISGCHTTSSLNSTPHSLNEAQLNLPGFHMYRIDEYLKTANEYIQFLPETLQLHNKIISKIGLEPNANSSNNMMRFINYTEELQLICKQDAMSDCLQRLLSQAVRL